MVKFQNIGARFVWTLFFLLSTLAVMIQLSDKSAHLLQKTSPVKKSTSKQSGKLKFCLKVTFWPKPNMLNSVYTKPLTLELKNNWLTLYFFKGWRNLWSYWKCQKIEVLWRLRRVIIKMCLLRQSQAKCFKQRR